MKAENQAFIPAIFGDEDSFLKGKMITLSLKRTVTPNLELPKLGDEDSN